MKVYDNLMWAKIKQNASLNIRAKKNSFPRHTCGRCLVIIFIVYSVSSWVKTIKIRLELELQNARTERGELRRMSQHNTDIRSLARPPVASLAHTRHDSWSGTLRGFIQIHRNQRLAATHWLRGQELTVYFLMSVFCERETEGKIQNRTFIPSVEMHKLKVCLNWKLPTHCQRKSCDERWKIRFDASSLSREIFPSFLIIWLQLERGACRA